MPNIQFQLRRGTASKWTETNPVLAAAEIGVETDTNQFKLGDGTTAWTSLGYGGITGPPGEHDPLTKDQAEDAISDVAGLATGRRIAQGAVKATGKIALLADVKDYNVSGGTFTSGADRVRDLTTETDPDSIVSLASNAFTPIAGTYLIEWSAPAYAVARHWSKLWNKTADTLVKMGSSEITSPTAGVTDISVGTAIVTANGTDEFEIRHRCQTTSATSGFGVSNNVSGNESIYTQVKLTKLA